MTSLEWEQGHTGDYSSQVRLIELDGFSTVKRNSAFHTVFLLTFLCDILPHMFFLPPHSNSTLPCSSPCLHLSSPLLSDPLLIVCGMLKPAGIWKSCHDWCSLKQLLSCSSKTGVSLYLAVCCTYHRHSSSHLLFLPPPVSYTFHQPPSHSLPVSWRPWLRTGEASSVEIPPSPIPTWSERPSPTACLLLAV